MLKVKPLLVLLLAILLLGADAPSGGDPLARADEAFGKKRYEQALKEYSAVLKVKPGDPRALYRAASAEALLFRYGEAAQRMSEAKLPSDPKWKARFLLLTAELGREFLKQYGHAVSQDSEEGTADVTRKTPEEWKKGVETAFAELWKMREQLLSWPLSGEADSIDLSSTDVELAPTMLDFVVLRFTGYLTSSEYTQRTPGRETPHSDRPDALALIASSWSPEWLPTQPPGAQAASLYEAASKMSPKGRELAAELWKLKRLELPFTHPDLVRSPEPEDEKPRKAFRARAIETFERQHDTLERPRARGLAGFRAASLLNDEQEYERAVQLCRRVEKTSKSTSGAEACTELRASIELPRVELEAFPVPVGGKAALRYQVRNVPDLYFRAWKTTPEELEKLQGEVRSRYGGGTSQDYSHLRAIDQQSLSGFVSREPVREWNVRTRAEKPYDYVRALTDFPKATAGIYVIAVSNDRKFPAGGAIVKGTVATVTQLFLVGSGSQSGLPSEHEAGTRAKAASRFLLYAIDAQTGAPATTAKVSGRLSDFNLHQTPELTLDAQGRAETGLEVQGYHHSHQLDAFAKRGEEVAVLTHPLNTYYQESVRYEVRLETDRPIYRPGQKVSVKVTGLERVPRGYRVYRGSGKVQLKLLDANYQEFFSKELTLSAMGSASIETQLPTGRLLGNYSINATLSGHERAYAASAQFRVEEYKRPEFEVALDAAKAAWKIGQKVSVSGSAKYYFGGPVPDAHVSYRIFRQVYVPWFCWWWRGFDVGASRREVASGQLKADADGVFKFDFVPTAPDNAQSRDLPLTFSVEVDARDAGGRTLSGNRDFRAGSKALLFNIPVGAGFYREGKPIELRPAIVDLNEQPASAEGSYELRRIETAPKADPQEWRFPGLRREPSLEVMFAQVPDGPKVGGGSLRFDGSRGAELSLKGLGEGLYRARFKARDPWGGEVEQGIVLVVVDTEKTGRRELPLPGVTLVEHPSYVPGEKAKILLGSPRLSGVQHVEVWGGRFLLARSTEQGGGLRLVDFPVNDEWKGGAHVRWFGAGGFEIRGGQAEIGVPWKDKELKTELAYDKSMKPGEKVSWGVQARDSTGKLAEGEATVRVFDRSLEYYAKGDPAWVKALYGSRWLEASEAVSMGRLPVTELPIERGWIKQLLELFGKRTRELRPPELFVNRARLYSRRSRMDERGAFGGAVAETAMSAAPAASMDALAKQERSASPAKEAAPAPADPAPRTNFSETAYFSPAVAVSKGSAKFSFQAPEQLTSWKLDASVLTADAKWGYASGEAVTKKDLMVRVEMPRFYREGDRGLLKAVVHNETERKLTGKVTLSVLGEGGTLALGLDKSLEKSFEVKPHGLQALSWPIAVSSGVRELKIRTVARSGELVDAEERVLPILPSRQRLVESKVVVLDGNARESMILPSMKKQDPTRENELMQLRVDPQVALTILNSLPFLIQYPYECTEQVLERFVPTGIVSKFYSKYPGIAEAVKKIPRRDTITPPWEKDDPRRLMTLMETPWKQQSEGQKSFWPLVDLLDPKVVERHRDGALATLQSYQLLDGGFPWFPGGRADPYMTLVVLAGLAEADRYGVEYPALMRDRALAYVMNEIPRHLLPDEGNVSLILYAAYVVTSFGQPNPIAKAWVDYALKHDDAMTPLGKAYAAHALWKLGDDKRGDDLLERALDGAREDPIAGVYWAPEKISWLWYNDTLEKHAFFLRTLMTRRPQDKRVAGMVKWILFNRKGNEWKSTKAAAAAIYSLLDVMKKRGALDQGDEFKISWGEAAETVKVGPTDWLAKPLAWTKTGKSIRVEQEPKVEKTGPGYAFASLTWIYSTEELPKEAVSSGLIGVTRKFFQRIKNGESFRLKPIESGGSVAVGDEVEVHLTVTTRSQFEYVHLKDPKGAGFEAQTLLSGWKWDQLGRYEEPRDSLTNFFMSWVPHGEYVLKYRLRATTAGSYRIGPAVLQSMYAPEMTGYSSGFKVEVTGE